MKIETLSLKDFRLFSEASFSFHSGLNLIVGANGSGKSSLLEGLEIAIASVANTLSEERIWRIEEDNVRLTSNAYRGQVRFERHYPSIVRASGEIFGQHLEWRMEKASDIDFPGSGTEVYAAASNLLKLIAQGNEVTLPLLTSYGVRRNQPSKAPSLEEAVTKQISRRSAYDRWFNALTTRVDLESWVIGKTLERLQLIESDDLYSPGVVDELRLVNSAARDTLENFTGLRYDIRNRALMAEFAGKNLSQFSNLSDGQRGMISLIFDIGRRMCTLNPHLGPEVFTETAGILIVDEIDIHLHPAWQRDILKKLTTTYPKLQIFATSHSPQMIGGLSNQEVHILQGGQLRHPAVTYGLDSSRVLESVMDVNARQPQIAQQLDKLLSFIDQGEIPSAKQLLEQVKISAPGLPEYARIEALLHRKGTKKI